jgi:hypothetical protein
MASTDIPVVLPDHALGWVLLACLVVSADVRNLADFSHAVLVLSTP